jgi:hypothetical protein
MNYDELIRNPKTRALWSGAMTKELAQLSQGIEGLTEGTNTVFFMAPEDIKAIPEDRTVTYARIVVLPDPKSRPQSRPNHRWWKFDYIPRRSHHPHR